MMPAFGFGQLDSILTGIYAAHDLAGKGKYEELVNPLIQSYHESIVIRRAMEQLNNHKLDRLVSILNTKFAKQMLTNQRYNPLKIASYLLRPTIKNKRGYAQERKAR